MRLLAARRAEGITATARGTEWLEFVVRVEGIFHWTAFRKNRALRSPGQAIQPGSLLRGKEASKRKTYTHGFEIFTLPLMKGEKGCWAPTGGLTGSWWLGLDRFRVPAAIFVGLGSSAGHSFVGLFFCLAWFYNFWMRLIVWIWLCSNDRVF